MRSESASFESYAFDDVSHGGHLKIDHTISLKDDNLSVYLLSKSPEELQAMRAESAAKEDFAYYDAISSARQWENQAAITRRIDRVIEYLKIPEVKHTFNEWVKGDYDYNYISNRVYKMSYRLQEGYSWRGKPAKWEVRWDLCINSPKEHCNKQIAGQEKAYADKADAEKYLQGRIKAYSHLFTEISPPVPEEHKGLFSLYGQLLPGYITEEMQKAQKAEKPKAAEKPSVRKQLAALKAQEKNTTPQEPGKSRSSPEL